VDLRSWTDGSSRTLASGGELRRRSGTQRAGSPSDCWGMVAQLATILEASGHESGASCV
jgi:hypothetical protein